MTTPVRDVLPSWRDGATRDALIAFLDASSDIPEHERLACFDNDGTLWVERPDYVQLDFFLDALGRAVAEDADLANRPEYAALLDKDTAAIGDLGLPRIAVALTELFEGMPPELFTTRVREFMADARHPVLGRPLRTLVYHPMLELVEELRRRSFDVAIVTGGGTEFVRAVSEQLYGVPPESVVGTLIEYDYADDGDRPSLRRTTRVVGGANEGPTKVVNIQTQLGRRPVMAAGNSDGDTEMLAWVSSGEGPTLSLLVDHDDAEREFAYSGHSVSLSGTEPVLDTAARLGWTVASMAHDWERVFPQT
jgi:phosphoserine phosphatase